MAINQPAGLDVSGAVSSEADGAVIDVWVVPGASRTEITGLHDGALRIRVAAPAEGGKANRALVKLLETIIGTETEMVRGKGSRRKQFLVRGVSSADLVRQISKQTE